MRNPLVKANSMLFEQVNKVVPWHELPRPLALLNLRAFRDELREMNLYGTDASRRPERRKRRRGRRGGAEVPHLRRLACNDPAHPRDGQGRRALRPQPPARDHDPRADAAADDAEPAQRQHAAPEPREVHPRDDAQRARRGLDPVREPRLVQPRRQRRRHDFIEVAAAEGRQVGRQDDAGRARPLGRPATTSRLPPTYINTVTHWWDGSQIYGSDGGDAAASCARARTAR